MEEITPPNLNNDQNKTPYNTDFEDFYRSKSDGIGEARYVFQNGNLLPFRWKNKQSFIITETGFGTGLNFLTTWHEWAKNPGECQQLHYISIEKHPLSVEILQKLLAPWPKLKLYSDELIRHYPSLLTGMHRLSFDAEKVKLTLCFMDIQSALHELNLQTDCWFLDGFAPAKNPEMWSQDVMSKLLTLSKPGTTLATYTAASQVRRNLQAAGWSVTKRPGFGGKREMLTAILPASDFPPSSKHLPWFTRPQIPATRRSATIIGGGIAGCQAAYALAIRGWDVRLIERHTDLAQEASGNPAGIISPKMTSIPGWGERFYRQAFLYTLQQLKQLAAAGHDIEVDTCGNLQLNHSAREEKRWQLLQQRNLPDDFIQFLNADQASTLTNVKLSTGGSFFPQAGWVNPKSYCKALSNHPNITVTLETAALKLIQTDQAYQVQSQSQLLPASDVTIIANGRDLQRLLPENHLPIMAVQGQTSTAPATDITKSLKTALGHEGYLTPAINGHHIFGATFERNIDSPQITQQADQNNWQQLKKHLPQFAAELHTPHSAHAAIRMTTPDRYPYVGPVPDTLAYQQNYADLHHGKKHKIYPAAAYKPGLFVASGFGSRGLTTAALCGELLASLINGEPLPVENSLYYQLHPARFLVKQLKQKPINRN
ncbi:MAG: bifunctional tRNA (5-methylaminomethyl-2-thiouridine)(34)-methyltransferase MnmD/FAD-dependent 5-carboxymethylaminomethyl-2-thiouridine(34) oxidoreductase MnmC [Thiolinea sp.]